MSKILTIKRLIILLGIILLLMLGVVISVYPNLLWFRNLNFSSVFWTMLIGRFGLAAVIWLLVILVTSINLYTAQRFHSFSGHRTDSTDETPIFGINANALILAGILIVSFVIASRGSALWDMVLRYLYQQPFGTADPVFNKDISFYVFSLPFYIFTWEQLLVLFIFAGIVTIIWYVKEGGLEIVGKLAQDNTISLPKITITENIRKHLLILGGIIVLLIGWGYHLKVYGLLYSTQGPAFGASYTDVHVKIPTFRISMVISFIWGLFVVYNAFKFNLKHLFISGAVWVGGILILTYGIPVLVQKVVVKPNELAKEAPFIAYNIDHTRKAYNLDNIREVDFEANDTLSKETIKDHDATIQNVRIWDESPLLQTYRQIQSIRLYYDFNNVDVDRYQIDNQYRQVMLSARELVVNQLPRQAKTWVNSHLIYTHGYGVAMSPVNEVTREGLPRLWIKDLPPSIDIDLKIDRPEIYYGEKTDAYVLVKTSAKEFDFPRGDKNVYTDYQGKGGVPIKSFLRRLLFAIEFMDPQILFTTYLLPDSRIMFSRRIDWRVNAIAPFLAYDMDPYMVVSEGKLFWIQDAYTTSKMYPYSRRSKSPFRNRWLNYIRNSVKVVIDAYSGDVSYFVVDEQDPILKTYSNIYPNLFKPLDQMPADLKKHIRYPMDLFEIQVKTYSTYHMQDVQVFYNQEDLWEPPDEIYGDNPQQMKPYYIIAKLPEGDKEEFLLMLPFTPSKKDNMIGWLAARSDLPNYGNLLVYKLSKEKLVYGPMQIEARVDQQTDISRELSLWDQKGSRVIRGNLLVIPVGDAFIYVEPIYLEAKQERQRSQAAAPPPKPIGKLAKRQPQRLSRQGKATTAALPELKRVIVALGNRITMEETLEKALNLVLQAETTYRKEASTVAVETEETSDSLSLALEHYHKAKDYSRNGDWAGYGRELDQLEKILNQLSKKTEKKE